MSYSLIVWLARWEVILFVGGLAVIVAVRLLTGQINTDYLLYETQNDGTKSLSATRVQLLLATLAIAIQYLLNASASRTGEMPSLPDGALGLLGLSNAIYLGRKAWAAFVTDGLTKGGK